LEAITILSLQDLNQFGRGNDTGFHGFADNSFKQVFETSKETLLHSIFTVAAIINWKAWQREWRVGVFLSILCNDAGACDRSV